MGHRKQVPREVVWAGQFGDEYTERNSVWPDRRQFWEKILERGYKRIIEVGCNKGFNLKTILAIDPSIEVWGVDVNKKALRELHQYVPDAGGGYATIFDLPFRTDWADLIFTVGGLIHLHPNTVRDAIDEMWRCGKEVLIAEYYAPQWTSITYHGRDDLLFKGPFGAVAESVIGHPVDKGKLSREEGFDNVRWWLF